MNPTISDLISLQGRTIGITGAGGGIGAAVARRLDEAGASLLLLDLDDDAIVRTQATLSRRHERVVLDVSNAGERGDFFASLSDERPLHGWVNAAGVAPRSPVLEITDEQWDHVMNTNTSASFSCSTAAARRMISGGVIVNVASSTVNRVSSNSAHYRASKAALVALTQSLAVELGPRGIRSLAVCPTLVETPAVEKLRAAGMDAALTKWAGRLPLGRPATPDEVARVVLFALSDLAAFMTGSALDVDGGERHQ